MRASNCAESGSVFSMNRSATFCMSSMVRNSSKVDTTDEIYTYCWIGCRVYPVTDVLLQRLNPTHTHNLAAFT